MAKPKSKRKRECYNKWLSKDMETALRLYRNHTVGLNEVSRRFNIPKSTFLRHLRGINKFSKEKIKGSGRRPVFPPELEAELVKYILQLERMLFGISKKDLLKLAFQLADRNGLLSNFNVETKSAGRYWFQNFLRRNPQISLRTPEATSIARASGFSRPNVEHFFNILHEAVDQKQYDKHHIFNMDETGVSNVQKRPQKILAAKGKHQVGTVSSAERGVNTTVVVSMNAAGTYQPPPMIIFRRKRMGNSFKPLAPPGFLLECQEKGWMNCELFLKWIKHFAQHVKPTKENPVLLILDGHSSHTSNLEAIEFARDNHIDIISLPPHCTHKLQPLDVGFFKPFQTYYDEALETKLRSNPGFGILTCQVPGLVNTAFTKAASIATAENAFLKCGIWPINRHIFDDEEFAPTDIVQRSVPNTVSVVNAANNTSDNPTATSDTEPVLSPTIPTPTDNVAHALPVSLPPMTVAEDPVNNSSTVVSDITCPVIPVENITFKVVPTKMDSRCFFRSTVIAASTNLQDTIRNESGEPVNTVDAILERSKADSLRSSVMEHIIENSASMDLPTTAVLNSDLPPSKQCANLIERFELMSNPTECVGEFEIMSTARVIDKHIIILDRDFKVINTYLPKPEAVLENIFLRFQNMGEYVGHYDLLLPVLGVIESNTGAENGSVGHVDNEVVKEYVSVLDISPLPVKKTKVEIMRKRKCQKSTLLTGSPHKKLLIMKDQQAEVKTKKTKKVKTVTKMPKTKITKSKSKTTKSEETEASWYCFMCEGSQKESMIQCRMCKKWVHVQCAGVDASCVVYACDRCIDQ